ncbi:unnamed protein product [Prorocentrum cordatum]|uniref:Uncharacterized protein n=1 Tax=Prorocentrum cordatum TaxID=2364126 RepID=A0ABN9QEX3_9DINO|nr:unnamed protein product [Polarella glacialis]
MLQGGADVLALASPRQTHPSERCQAAGATRHQTQSCSTLGAAHWDGLLAGLEAPERRVDLRPGRPVVLSVEVALGHGDQLLPVRGDADLTGAPDAL